MCISPIYRASQDLKIPFKTLKSAYFYLKHAHIPQKYILEQVLSEGSTAQNGQKVLFDSENPLSHYRALTAKSDLQDGKSNGKMGDKNRKCTKQVRNNLEHVQEPPR